MFSKLCLLAFILLPIAKSEVLVCYFGSWATYRNGNGKFNVEDIDPFLCTHLVYGFVGLDASTNTVKLLDSYNDVYDDYGKGAITRFNNLRNQNPQLKTTVAIGGWNEGSQKYSQMAASPSARSTFVQSAVNFCLQYGFNGMDLDWEYPTDRGGVAADKQNFILLISELRAAFNPKGLLLTAAVSAGKSTIDNAYDVPNLDKNLDYVHVMTYDYHGSWESVTGNNAPLYPLPQDATTDNFFLNLNYSIHYWLSKGISKEKLVIGMPLYGHTFTLANSNNFGLYAPTTGPGNGGPYTQEPGTLGYNEICEKFKTQNWNVQVDPYQRVPYGHNGNQWLSYDDVDSIKIKTEFIKSFGLAGGMVWSIETDDFRGSCGPKYSLLNTIKSTFQGGPSATSSPVTTTATTTTSGATTTTSGVTTSTAAATTTTTKAPTTTTTTTTASGGDPVLAQCKSGKVYVRDATNCSKFYQCVDAGNGNYNYYSYTCSAGLSFDLTTNNCNWSNQVAC